MRLNLDCVRDILLCVEDVSGPHRPCMFTDFGSSDSSDYPDVTIPPYQIALNQKYSNDEFIYHIKYCSDASLVSGFHYYTNELFCIDDLAPLGHEFLANIRSDSNYHWLKNALSKIGSDAIPIAMQLIADHLLGMR